MARSPENLLELFESRQLDPAGFRHRDHVALAWALLRRDPALEAMEKYIAGLRQLTLAAGHPEAYHATITWAFLLLVQERLGRDREAGWEKFEQDNSDLFSWKPSVLERYYRPETLGSDLARQVFVLPDLLAVPV